MIDDARKIFDCMPVEYKTQTESDYITFLWDAFSINYEKDKYQFAYIAYHMLFMCFIYFQLAKIYLNKSEEKNMLIFTGKAQKAIENYEAKVKEAAATNKVAPHFDPFRLAEEYERSIVGLFLSVGCSREVIKKMKRLVDDRNDIAHSNGNIAYSSQRSLDDKIEQILECVDCVQNNSNTIITNCTEQFLINSSDPDTREFPDEENQIREILIRGNYLSPRDIMSAKQLNIKPFEERTDFQFIDALHKKLIEMYPDEN
jgi:hypothetical protein